MCQSISFTPICSRKFSIKRFFRIFYEWIMSNIKYSRHPLKSQHRDEKNSTKTVEYFFSQQGIFSIGRHGVLSNCQKKVGKKTCSGLIHNHVILSDKSDKIKKIPKRKQPPSWHPLLVRPLHDFFPLFFGLFSYYGSPSDRGSLLHFSLHVNSKFCFWMWEVGHNIGAGTILMVLKIWIAK